MKQQMKKVLGITALGFLASTAHAEPFYLNVGQQFDTDGVKVGGPLSTNTGSFQEMNIGYHSTTIITDANGSGILDAGDTVLGSGGTLKFPSFPGFTGLSSSSSFNRVTDFSPTYDFTDPTSPSLNGYGTQWRLTFGWDNLSGVVNPTGGINYNSGTIHIFLTYNGNPTVYEVAQLDVSSGGNNAIGQSLNLNGTVDVKAVPDPSPNLFNWTADMQRWYDSLVDINFEANQNTQPFYVNGLEVSSINPLTFYNGSTTGYLEGKHDGSLSFSRSVPEPGSIALLGSALIGLCALRRRKKA